MRLEWLILADAAQVIGDKLYLLGGGWTVVTANVPPPFLQHMAVACAFEVPWNETNETHKIELEIQDQDGGSLAKVEGDIEVGRPAGIPSGQSQRFQLCVDLNLQLPKLGEYVIIARLRKQDQGRVAFNIVPSPMLALQLKGPGNKDAGDNP